MAYFIKTGFWEKARKAPKEWLNLNLLISQISFSIQTIDSSSSISVVSKNSTLTTNQATIAVDIPFTGDDSTLELILNTTNSVLTFPTGSLCVAEGIASGDNTLTLSGTSGDHYIIGIKKMGDSFYIVSKNFGQ